MSFLDMLVERLRELPRRQVTLLIGIDGPGGAGKSTLARKLASSFEAVGQEVTVLHHDDFFLPELQRLRNEPKAVGGDFDWQRLRDQVLLPLKENRPGRYQRYDWQTDSLAEWHTVPKTGIVIVEGIYVLRPGLADLYDFKVWVDCPRAIRLARGVARDGEEGRAVWEQDWMPKEDRYIEICRPHEAADARIDGSSGFFNEISAV